MVTNQFGFSKSTTSICTGQLLCFSLFIFIAINIECERGRRCGWIVVVLQFQHPKKIDHGRYAYVSGWCDNNVQLVSIKTKKNFVKQKCFILYKWEKKNHMKLAYTYLFKYRKTNKYVNNKVHATATATVSAMHCNISSRFNFRFRRFYFNNL